MTVDCEGNNSTDSSVKVALRIRPQNAKERMQMNQICTSVTNNEPQIFIGKDKAFTFDYVFDCYSKQEDIYSALARPLIDGCLEGYNATILAYGQTGSGKTYTMGSGFDMSLDLSEIGIIPRSIQYLFDRIDKLKMDYKKKMLPVPDFKIVTQFLELYNEELIDLFAIMPENKNQKSHIKIHEDTGGSIYLTGVSTRVVTSVEDTLKCLKDGTLCRSTASTNMNSQSSRSHAIFTLHIKQQRLINTNEDTINENSSDFETLTAKFHFVDLAGSERLKRTGATGERAKEGISINCGLLALGNVISILGDNLKHNSHVPYRNSKLTRLLQDSLGGNSQTIMIACVSPSDCDFLETLNTLNYANRTRNIKNKVTVNQDKASKQFAAMKQQIEKLEAELLQYKQGIKTAESTKDGSFSDIYMENNILQSDNHNSRIRIKALSDTIDVLKARNAQILAEKEACLWKYKKDNMNPEEINELDFESDEVMKVIEKYTLEVEELRAKLAESDAMVFVLQRSNTSYFNMENSKQSHINITNEFPEEDSVFDNSMLKWDQTPIIKKKVQTPNPQHNENTVLIATSICEGGDNHVTEISSDIDKDSLNGDLEEGSGSEHSCGEDSDTENQDAENYLHQSLATLSSEIDVKKRLINELQAKQKQLKKIREHYEQQLQALYNKIKETESERDQVLANLGEVEVTNEERVRKVRMEYERKLSSLKEELNQLQTAKREHTLMLKNQQRKDHELKLLQKELNDLKSLKVQLTKKLREETKRTREVDNIHNKEIVQLRKEKRIADHQIKNLEHEKMKKDVVLKRKQEEVESLRKRQSKFNLVPKPNFRVIPMPLTPSVSMTTSSSRVGNKSSYRVGKPHARRNSILARVTKSKLNSIENALKKTIIRQHTMNSFEQDLNTRVREREKLSSKLQVLERHRQEFIKNKKNTEDISYEINNVKSQIEMLQEEINECQSNILDIEESKLEESVSDIISKCTLDEAQYLLEQVYQMTVSKGILAQTLESHESSLKLELESKILEREQALDMLRIALQHSTVPFDMDGIFADESEEEDDPNYSDYSNVDNTTSNKFINNTYHEQIPHTESKRVSMKRKQATPEELLGVCSTSNKSNNLNFNFENNNNSSLLNNFQQKSESIEINKQSSDDIIKEKIINNAWTADISTTEASDITSPRSPHRKPLTWKHPGGSMTTSLIVSKNDIYTENYIQNYNTLETPPSSPSNFRRASSQKSTINEENVFKRLTSTRPSPNPTRGSISLYSKKNLAPTVPLQCIYAAEGHLKAVLDLDISNNIMITGSKDRSAKIWDLTTLMEIDSLTDHQSSVTKVRYSSNLNMAYTISTFYIKMWDLRDSKKCIRTLWSSGLSQEGPPEFSQTSRQTICPPGENFIMDITFSSNENNMFLATANSVKLWDMRRFCAIGKLHGNHQAPVMVLASCDKDRTSSLLVTGSKDHYIKVFDVSPGSVGLITPCFELQPPHYDGVESLSLVNNILLSGSRDACIKKWDLSTGVHVTSISQAHRDWIQALCFTSDRKYFVSGCRSGIIKLWTTDNCSYIGDVQAHQCGINALKSSADRIFSASNDGSVRIWQKSSDDN